MLLKLYQIISILIYPLFLSILKKRLKINKECPTRHPQKLGKNLPNITKKGQLFWFYAASVGESLSVMPLIKELCDRGNTVVITTTTLSSANLLTQKLPSAAIHCFSPFDSVICVKRFLNHFRPDIFVLVEEEFWPNAINLAKKFCKKSYFLNAKFSIKSANKWTKHQIVKKTFISLLNKFDNIFASATSSKQFFTQLGVKFTEIKSLKYYTINNFNPTLPEFNTSFNPLTQNTIVSVSSHPGEEELILQAFIKVKERLPNPFLFLIPRHTDRSSEIENLAKQLSLNPILLSNVDNLTSSNNVLIIDKMGLVTNYCLASKVIIMCGSLIDKIGGHNILEPAFLAKPIITGAFNENFADIISDMQKDEAIYVLKSTSPNDIATEISTIVVKCFQNTTFCKELSENAKKHIDNNANDYKLICDKLQQ